MHSPSDDLASISDTSQDKEPLMDTIIIALILATWFLLLRSRRTAALGLFLLSLLLSAGLFAFHTTSALPLSF